MFYSKNDPFQGENLQKRILFVKMYVLKELVLEKELHQFSFLSLKYTQIQSFSGDKKKEKMLSIRTDYSNSRHECFIR